MFDAPIVPITPTRSGTWPRYSNDNINMLFPPIQNQFPHPLSTPTPTNRSTTTSLPYSLLDRDTCTQDPLSPTKSSQNPPLNSSREISGSNSSIVGGHWRRSSENSDFSLSPDLHPSSSSPLLEIQTPTPPPRQLYPRDSVVRYPSYQTDLEQQVTPTNGAIEGFNTMSNYHTTPSPQPSYGIQGGLFVPNKHNNVMVMSSENSCPNNSDNIPHPHDDTFYVSSKPSTVTCNPQRPVLRPTQSHNGAIYQQSSPIPPTWSNSRRMSNVNAILYSPPLSSVQQQNSRHSVPVPSTIHTNTNDQLHTSDESSRPSTTQSLLLDHSSVHHKASSTTSSQRTLTGPVAIPAPNPSATTSTTSANIPVPAGSTGESVGGQANNASFNSLSSSAPAQVTSAPVFGQANGLNITSTSVNGNSTVPSQSPYNDELSYHTTSYAGSYDSSFSSNGSPWAAPCYIPVPHQQQGYPVQGNGPQFSYMYHTFPRGKEMEPILEPGELPAPRPIPTFAALIGEALLSAPPPHQLYVSEISESIKRRYAYYRQNPSKAYNGVRHQTSMCKAFVKLPRPFGDQSGGARKWAIRAGYETSFAGGKYHPPGSSSPSLGKKSGGKAKSTAKAKQLVIGTNGSGNGHHSGNSSGSPESRYVERPMWSPGPSSGPAYDGTSQPMMPFSYYPAPPHGGYRYVPITHPHHPPHDNGHMQGEVHPHTPHHPGQHNQVMYVPVWNGAYGAPPPPPPSGMAPPPSAQPNAYPNAQAWSKAMIAQEAQSSPEQWRSDDRGILLSDDESQDGRKGGMRASPRSIHRHDSEIRTPERR